MLNKDLLAMVLKKFISLCQFFRVSRGINNDNFPLRVSDFQQEKVSRFNPHDKYKNYGTSGLTTEEVLKMIKSKGKRPARLLHVLEWWLRLSPEERNDVAPLAILSATWEGKIIVIQGRFDKGWLTLEKIPKKWGTMESATSVMCNFVVID